MLEIILGRANTGKSARILEKIQKSRGGDQLLLVPEHASHQAELDLCRVCGPTAARRAEVLSFRLLAHRVLAVTGGLAEVSLDAGGKILMMQRALQEVSATLQVYRRPSQKTAFLSGLVALAEEFQACRVQPEDLSDVLPGLTGMSAGKVHDLAIIYAAYQSRLRRDGQDRRDAMEKLAERLAESGCADGRDVYLDGFTYFTAQEEAVIDILLRRARSVTVTLLGQSGSDLEIFQQGLRARDRLIRLADRQGAVCRVTELPPREPEDALGYIESAFFGGGPPWRGEGCGQVELHRAQSAFAEAEYAAASILGLVRSGQYRFRDIAVTARNLADYEGIIESVFERYGVPVYLSRRSDVLEKPVLSLIAGALDAVVGGCEYEDMFRWLKTGLAGITDGECDRLENYAIAWDIHGSMWLREAPWTANPGGWKEGFSEAEAAELAALNEIRERVRLPLLHLSQGLRAEKGAAGKLRILYAFLEEIDLPGQLTARTRRLEELGDLQRAREYSQLWELLCDVMDQFADILEDAPLDAEEFVRLLKLVLTQYDVGTIPVSLDQVQITQITRNDRHRTRCLFLLGANDHVLPAVQPGQGLLSEEDRERLGELGLELAPSGMELFHIELENLYAALAQPSERLIVSWPASDGAGNELRPSFVLGRLRALLPGAVETVDAGDHACRLHAVLPALEMAGADPTGAIRAHFAGDSRYAGAVAAMDRAAAVERGRLSPAAVETLYGRSYRMSASRIDKLGSCHFAYFMEYGLRAKERTPAGFDAAQVGTFLHYVLEHVTREAVARGGFAQLAEGELQQLIGQVIERYMAAAMPGFQERDARFRYLFRRLRRTVTAIVENVAQELAVSDFVPMAFELAFGGEDGDLPALTIRAPEASLTLTGKVDRVDGWIRDGKLYLRVVDYKSGKKTFDLADIRCGLNIQMLLYLFALEREGEGLFGRPVVPAGVLYLPARDVMLSMDRSAGPEEIRAALDRELRRSGLVLGEPEVLRAMEHSALESPRFLPLTLGRDGSITKGIAAAGQLGKLGRYVDEILKRAAEDLAGGNIDADPRGRSETDCACTYCEFASACHFGQGGADDRLELIRPVTAAEFWDHVDKTIGEEERLWR
ncbi:MAG: ATP-dependent nuclease subunit B [Oscillospiraceae bacterium]|jgi:ATP-dependent helicase/nuclease subunit B|nr:ATP-dependent nuclease subunit B [Oscillospiraceae bacterium]